VSHCWRRLHHSFDHSEGGGHAAETFHEAWQCPRYGPLKVHGAFFFARSPAVSQVPHLPDSAKTKFAWRQPTPYVGASLEVMQRDAHKMRDGRPFVFTNLKSGDGIAAVADFVVREGMLHPAGNLQPAAP